MLLYFRYLNDTKLDSFYNILKGFVLCCQAGYPLRTIKMLYNSLYYYKSHPNVSTPGHIGPIDDRKKYTAYNNNEILCVNFNKIIRRAYITGYEFDGGGGCTHPTNNPVPNTNPMYNTCYVKMCPMHAPVFFQGHKK